MAGAALGAGTDFTASEAVAAGAAADGAGKAVVSGAVAAAGAFWA